MLDENLRLWVNLQSKLDDFFVWEHFFTTHTHILKGNPHEQTR